MAKKRKGRKRRDKSENFQKGDRNLHVHHEGVDIPTKLFCVTILLKVTARKLVTEVLCHVLKKTFWLMSQI